MEEHTMTTICRRSIALIAFVAAAITANANSLLNPGFETAGTAATNAANWVGFNDAFRSTAYSHSGTNSMQTYGPFEVTPDASGAYQAVSATSGQKWRLTGYCMNPSGDPLLGPNSYGPGESSYGAGELVFYDSTGTNILLTVDGPHYGTDVVFPLNVWEFFEVDATAPTNTATVRAQVIHVGYSPNPGSVYFDDMNLYQPTGTTTTNSVTTQPAVQVSWPTTAPSNTTVDVQIQSTGNLVFSNQAPVNLLVNPSFEPGIDGAPNATSDTPMGTNGHWLGWNNWTSPYQAYFTQSVAEDGVQAIKTYSGPNGGVYQYVPVTAGTTYTATGWFINSSVDHLQTAETDDIRMIFFSGANGTGTALGTFVSPLTVNSSSTLNQWIQLSVTAVAPAGAVSVQLMGFFQDPDSLGGSMFADNFSLIATSAGGPGWQNFGPVYPGNGLTNQIYDTVGTNKTKFYRVTTTTE